MSRLIEFTKDAIMYLGVAPEQWSSYRRTVRLSEHEEIVAELRCAEGSLTNALAYGSQGRYTLGRDDRVALLELIDTVRNYIDHVEGE